MKLTLLFLLLPVCVLANFEGTFQLDRPLDYKRFFWEKTAQPGDYLIKISKNMRSLKLKFRDVDGKKHTVKIKMPRHALPEHGGSITLLPGQTGQHFGMEADYRSDTIRREERTVRESCTIQVRVRRCTRDENGRQRCRYTTENRPGFQYARYMFTTLEKNLDLRLMDSAGLPFGQSESRNITTRSDLIYRGSCQRN